MKREALAAHLANTCIMKTTAQKRMETTDC